MTIWVWVAEAITSVPGLIAVGVGLGLVTVRTAVQVDAIDRAVARWLACHALWLGWDGRLKATDIDGETVDVRMSGREAAWWSVPPHRCDLRGLARDWVVRARDRVVRTGRSEPV